MYAFHKYTYCECMRGQSFLEQCVFFHQMETAALMKTSQLAKKSNCLPEWIQENEEPYRYRAWGTGFSSFCREQRRGRGGEGPPLSAAHRAAAGARSPPPRRAPCLGTRSARSRWPGPSPAGRRGTASAPGPTA